MRGLLRIRYTLPIVPRDAQLSVIFLWPSALPVDSSNDRDWSQIRILLPCKKSGQPAWAWRRRHEKAHFVVIREVTVCTSYQLLRLTFVIFSSTLKHKLSKQYLSSNLDGALMLSKCTMKRSCCYVLWMPHSCFFLYTLTHNSWT